MDAAHHHEAQVRQEDIDLVMVALRHGKWIKGRQIAKYFKIPNRKIRAVAEATGDIISGPKGYRLAAEATDEEIRHAYNDLMSRSRRIAERAQRMAKHIKENNHSEH